MVKTSDRFETNHSHASDLGMARGFVIVSVEPKDLGESVNRFQSHSGQPDTERVYDS